MVGYVLGYVAFGYLLAKGAGKVADVAGDFSKGAKAAMSVMDDGTIVLKGQYVDDAAKYIDDLADSAKYADDVADVADDIVDYQKLAKQIADKVGDSLKPQDLLDELAASGEKVSMDKVVAVTKDADGKLIWLEQGNLNENGHFSAGLGHILEEHGKDFVNIGIPEDEIPKFIVDTITSQKAYHIRTNGEKVYRVIVNGKENFFRAVISDNGFIVNFFLNNHSYK